MIQSSRRTEDLFQNRLFRQDPHLPLPRSIRPFGHRARDHDHAGRRVLRYAVANCQAGTHFQVCVLTDDPTSFNSRIFPSPTTRRGILLINSALCASAAFTSVLICFKVLVFDPKMTVPPITAAIAPVMTVGSNPTAPMIIAKITVPPAATAAFEMRMILRHLSMTSVSSSMLASMCKICSCRSPPSSI
jgi:hypothetical protein